MMQDVVISGISGRFPECLNVAEFKSKLLSGECLLKCHETTSYSYRDYFKAPIHKGSMPDWKSFDESFFGISIHLAHNFDPHKGIMMERTFEAIMDSGNNPFEMKGRKIAVVTAIANAERMATHLSKVTYVDGAGMVGNAKTMHANRISYFFNFTGPSYNYDSSASSGLGALELATAMIRDGTVEAAVVGSVNVFSLNSFDTELKDMNYLSQSGRCFPFDEKAEGIVSSEGAVVFFLQRAQDAKRNYCTLVNPKSLYLGNRPCGFIKIDSSMESFLDQYYSQEEVDADGICYVEANSCSKKEIDAVELNALTKTFNRKNDSPLLIGSVAGNVGFGDAVAGYFSMVKAIIALESDVIPPTINYTTPNSQVPALINGTLKPVTEPMTLGGNKVAVSSLSMFGSVDHVILKRHNKTKKLLPDGELPEDGLHRLLTFQSRHEEGANKTLQQLSSMPLDTEFVSMVNDAFKTQIPAYKWRGFTVAPLENSTMQALREYSGVKRPLWFIFSGMGSQWAGMGKHLLKFPVFASAIDKCDKVLQPKGLDIKHIINTDDEIIFKNILNCFVGIAAIQIGLVDILKSVGIEPDGMIGHSVGELGCAYADGCFSAEETILAAYARGKASLESDVIPGMMAAVGKGYNVMKDQLPPSIDVACHNSADSCTLSGPTDDVNKYVEQLQAQGVFARSVSAGGIAYHSRYIKSIAPKLLQYLKETVKNPKPRSSKWVSSSVPEAQWETAEAKLCSAEYHTNNLLSPVLFEEACKHLPQNAILLEIAPRGLLQAILKRSMAPDNICISLTERNSRTSYVNVLQAIGHLYVNGIDMTVNSLFPAVEYPVARNTPSLVNLISWNHVDPTYVDYFQIINKILVKGKNSKSLMVSKYATDYEEWKMLNINGQPFVPLSCLLIHPWQMIIARNKLDFYANPISFGKVDVRKHLPILETESTVEIAISESGSSFELSLQNENNSYTEFVVGDLSTPELSEFDVPIIEENQVVEELTTEQVYSILAEFGYSLTPKVQLIKQYYLGDKECFATVEWDGHLSRFLEALFHVVMVFHTDIAGQLMLPACWDRLQINMPMLRDTPSGLDLKVHYDQRCTRLVCEAVELLGLTLSPATNNLPQSLSWKQLKLQPYMDTKLSMQEFFSLSLQLAAEDGFESWSKKIVSVEVLVLKLETEDNIEFLSTIRKELSSDSNIDVKILEVDYEYAKRAMTTLNRRCCIVAGEFHVIAQLTATIQKQAGFYLAYVNSNNGICQNITVKPVLACSQNDGTKLVLLRKEQLMNHVKVFEAKKNDWLVNLKQLMKEEVEDTTVIVYTHVLTPGEVLPALAKEAFSHQTRVVFVEDKDAPQFSLNSSLYSSQLSLGLPVNILSGKVWSSRREFNIEVNPCDASLASLLLTSDIEDVNVNYIGINSNYLTETSSNVAALVPKCEIDYIDYSGTVRGKKVMGLAQYDSTTDHLILDPILQWEVSDSWNMEDAATVPVTSSMAFYSVFLEGKLGSSETMLVNAKISILTKTMIKIALEIGALVFVSVEDDDEAVDLQKEFPSLKSEHVVVLHRQNLKDRIMRLTEGKGVDVIINAHGGKMLQDAVSLTAEFGRFVHLSCTKVGSGERIGMSNFFKNNFVKSVNIGGLLNCDADSKKRLQTAMSVAIEHGIVKPSSRRVFSPLQKIEALRNAQEEVSQKTIIDVNDLKLSMKNSSLHGSIKVIVSEGDAQFLLDLAEWLVEQGCRKLVVLTGENQLNDSHLRRFARLVDSKQVFLAFASTTRLDTHDNSVQFLKELLHVATITSIFCIGLDENKPFAKNLDSASRELLTSLKDFVSLLGEGTVVCESRASSGLPAISIQSKSTLQSPEHLLPFLAAILSDKEPSQAKFFYVEDKLHSTVDSDTTDYNSFLPSDTDTVYKIGTEVSDKPHFHEEATMSPGYRYVCKTLLPVFVVPGLGSDLLRPFIKQLIHPAFSCSLPLSVTSVRQFAESLLQDILKIQPRGPYNIVGESWSGAVALTLSCMLEARGHQVELFLVEAVPSVTLDRIKALCDSQGQGLETSLISTLFQLPVKKLVGKNINARKWEENIQTCLNEVAAECRQAVSRGATAVYQQLENLAHYQPDNMIFQGNLTLITHKPVSPTELNKLYKMCAKAPTVVTTHDESYEQLISNSTANIINKNVTFAWNI